MFIFKGHGLPDVFELQVQTMSHLTTAYANQKLDTYLNINIHLKTIKTLKELQYFCYNIGIKKPLYLDMTEGAASISGSLILNSSVPALCVFVILFLWSQNELSTP